MPIAQTLTELNAQIDRCTACETLQRDLRHVSGGGCDKQPDVMLIFINPTVRNFTAHAGWSGPRFPFAGKPKLWQILAEAGFVDIDLPGRISMLGPTPEMVELLRRETRRCRLYLTNAVKCVDDGSSLPTRLRLAAAWSFLQTEIALVRPHFIVSFGLLPFRQLTGMTVRLADELWKAQHGYVEAYPSRSIDGRTYPVFPCYFPTGRGNPVAAARMLTSLRHQLAALR